MILVRIGPQYPFMSHKANRCGGQSYETTKNRGFMSQLAWKIKTFSCSKAMTPRNGIFLQLFDGNDEVFIHVYEFNSLIWTLSNIQSINQPVKYYFTAFKSNTWRFTFRFILNIMVHDQAFYLSSQSMVVYEHERFDFLSW